MRRFAVKAQNVILSFALCLGTNAALLFAQVRPPDTHAEALFDFHSDFWINLHHFLYLEAMAEKQPTRVHPATMDNADVATLKSLTR
jgi:hypothetical protein